MMENVEPESRTVTIEHLKNIYDYLMPSSKPGCIGTLYGVEIYLDQNAVRH